MQFQYIKSHEDEAEIHCDLGFSEVAEARVSVIVFELCEDWFGFQRSPFQLLPVRRKIKPCLCFAFFPYVAEFAVNLFVFVLWKYALVFEWTTIAVITCHHGNVAAEPTSCIGFFPTCHLHHLSSRTDECARRETD